MGVLPLLLLRRDLHGGLQLYDSQHVGSARNNPFCYHRAETLKHRGKRERLVQVERAQGVPYDFGRFEIVEEDWGTGVSDEVKRHTRLDFHLTHLFKWASIPFVDGRRAIDRSCVASICGV